MRFHHLLGVMHFYHFRLTGIFTSHKKSEMPWFDEESRIVKKKQKRFRKIGCTIVAKEKYIKKKHKEVMNFKKS